MLTNIQARDALHATFNELVVQFVQLLSTFSDNTINTRAQNCWSAGQVGEHLIKSNTVVTQALNQRGTPATREADQRVPELKAMFLDFSTKFNSPAFILPGEENYNKETLIRHFEESAAQLLQACKTAILSQTITDPALGEISKLELMHFVIFHTQRHIHQLKNIAEAEKIIYF